MEKNCVVCEKPFNAKRASAKFCSPTCRKAYSRQVGDEPVMVEQVKVIDNEWLNSAETKTQEEIEAHYTLENFPPVQYHSANGGGTGTPNPPKLRH